MPAGDDLRHLSGKPPAISNEQALADLQGIADGFLIHNRDIVQRMDDSVVRRKRRNAAPFAGYVRMRWLCLRALKMFRLCCVSARI
ncbi:hydrogenase maturation protein hypF [Escherichia coli]|uniref:Hydrogenase maturation protein hypF n=1 Tax=Escherichia coli TaxID=562 RepID=A0A376NU05_ECOLX|nr:hydrogenase maturation protein hypF [Escherichia coli]